MSPASGAGRAEQELVRLCHSGLDLPALRTGVLRSLRRIMPVDAAFFATADPETLLFTSGYSEEPLAAATALFLDNEFRDADVNKFTTLATASTHVSSLDAATRGDRWSSGRYRDIMRPAGLGDELRVALTTGGDCWGFLCLHRTDHPLGFSPVEAALVARVGPHIAHALRQTVLLHGPAPAADDLRPGVLVLAEDLTVVAATPEADALLAQLEPARHLPLPTAVYAVAAALSRDSAAPTTRVHAASGRWLALHASRLDGAGAGRVAVVVEPCAPRATVAIRLAAYGLSRREAEVARLVLRGSSTRAICAALHISPHTVQDHLKNVFDKLGVRSRRDLVGLMLGG
ncbi:DNA-binding CsgD family transcriptional regulator [Pseudonocardia hierapolitana]|uniref:DNA-binding CsgD family transcriptional regulator n=1 Tax=Pseudonocardia hierapolitana TaxID=1128676 RepID=A0A561T294_9PSEU|nr:helix-turn-helix transcriptional regulator [Pseudonocardia hierapolitana]TWF81228.1 DNA-binding CsgD family transcriptional regulator [Pseudonocardia hierapolitana]